MMLGEKDQQTNTNNTLITQRADSGHQTIHIIGHTIILPVRSIQFSLLAKHTLQVLPKGSHVRGNKEEKPHRIFLAAWI